MIPDIQVLEIIEERFAVPGITRDKGPSCIFGAFQKIAVYAAELINDNNHTELSQLLHTIDELHSHCGKIVSNAVENVFIFHLIGYIDLHAQRNEIIALFPLKLAAIVSQQRNAPGI